MRKLLNTTLAGIVVATASIASVAPASADPRFIERSYRGDGYDRDYRRFSRDRREFRRDAYRGDRRYYRNRRDNDFGGAAIFGLAAGAIAGAALAGAANYDQVDNGYLAACQNKYRSFDPASGTYLGYDGYRHACRL